MSTLAGRDTAHLGSPRPATFRTVTTEIASKSLRKAQKAIRDAGADNVTFALQGRLAAGDVISEAASAQPKAARR